MTFGNRKFTRFLGAATIVIIAEYVLVLSDCVISGRILGETALGAMNLLMPVFSTVSFFTWLIATGTAILYADAMGRADPDRAAGIAGQGLATAVLTGMMLVAATWSLETPYLAFMAPDEATMTFSGQYWDWYPLIVILEALDMTLLYLVYTDGGSQACMLSYVGQVVVNISASTWLAGRLGMAGISLGTVFAYIVGIAALLPHLLSTKCGLRFRPHFDLNDLFRSCRASFGDASAGLFHALLFFVITKYILFNWGSETLPIATVVFCVVRLTVFFNGVGIALQPLETVYHGEDNETAVTGLVKFAGSVAFAEGLAFSLVLFVAPELIVSLVGIHDPDLVLAAKKATRISVVGLSGYAFVYMLNSHYQYVGRPGLSIKLTVLAFFLVPTALLLLLGGLLGTDGVWMAVAAGPACAIASFLPLVKRIKRNGPVPVMRTVRTWIGDDVRATTEKIRKRLQDEDFPSARADEIAALVENASAAIRDANPTRRICAEFSLDRRDGLKLTIRDDGRSLSLDRLAGSASCTHLPAAGFNRNIFRWRAPVPEGAVEEAPLNYLQKYILLRMEEIPGQSRMFNLAKLFRLRDGIDLQRLSAALVTAARSHASLLTTLRKDGDRIVQRRAFSPDAIQCPIVRMPEDELLRDRASLVKTFDVFGDLLLDAKIYDCGRHAYLLSNFHHLICDGYSFPVILNDAHRIWDGGTVEPDAYYEMLARREDSANTPMAIATRGILRETMLNGNYVSLPRDDFSGPHGYGALEFEIALPPDFDEQLARRKETRHHVFLAAAALTLARLENADAVVVDWVFHGRLSHAEQQTVGAFIADIPLLVEDIPSLTSGDLIAQVKQATFRGIKSSRFFRDVEDCNPRKEDRLTFIYQDEWGELMSPGPVRPDGPFAWMIDETVPLSPNKALAENPFNVEIMEHRNVTRLFLEYDSGRFSETTVRRYAELFREATDWLLQ